MDTAAAGSAGANRTSSSIVSRGEGRTKHLPARTAVHLALGVSQTRRGGPGDARQGPPNPGPPPCAPEEFSPVHSLAKGYRAVGGHLGSPSVPGREGKDPCGYWPRVRRTCRVRTAKSSGISRQLSADVSAEASAVGPSAEASGIRTTNGLAA